MQKARSLPARGAWIEMTHPRKIEKGVNSRSPHGERGLKSAGIVRVNSVSMSLPARGAWIEIRADKLVLVYRVMSLPARGAWIEIRKAGD